MTVWATLGLERTSDVSAIRRAYARMLKTIDVDADPSAFIALRNALDEALRDVQDQAWAAERQHGPVSLAKADPPAPEPVDLLPAEAPAIPADVPPDAQPGQDDGARYIALEQLLFDPEGRAPDPDALTAAVREILDHPDMGRIDSSAGIENWLAQAIYEAAPRSDPVLPLVADHFDWGKNLGRWDNPWLIEELIRRRQTLDFIDQINRPSHPLHKAWLDLGSQETELSFVSRRRAPKVRELLEAIRRDHPAAESCLSTYRVATWDTELYSQPDVEERTGNWIWIAVVVGLGLFRLLGSHYPSTTAPAPPAPFVAEAPRPATTPQADMNEVIIHDTGGRYDLDDLAERNPVLHARLLARWETFRAAPAPLRQFQADIDAMLRTAERETLRGGSYALQSAFWALRRDELDYLRGRDPAACARGADGDFSEASLPAEYSERRDDIRTQALGERLPANVAPAATGARSYPIPGAAVQLAMRHSGLARERLAAAWLNRGTMQDRCLAQIGLIEAALALPQQQGRTLLRNMSAGL